MYAKEGYVCHLVFKVSIYNLFDVLDEYLVLESLVSNVCYVIQLYLYAIT